MISEADKEHYRMQLRKLLSHDPFIHLVRQGSISTYKVYAGYRSGENGVRLIEITNAIRGLFGETGKRPMFIPSANTPNFIARLEKELGEPRLAIMAAEL